MAGRSSWSRRDVLRAGLLAGGSVAASGLAGGCAAAGFGSTLERIKEQGFVTVGIAGERPYAYMQGGNLVGAIPAIHRAVFDRIGDVELRAVKTPFKDLLDGLNSGNFDVVSAGMFITSDRCRRAAFSDPTYCAKEALLVRQGNPQGLSDYHSVARKGATLAVLAGGVEIEYARAIGITGPRLVTVGSQREGLRLVVSGRVAAFTLTSISLRALLEQVRQQQRSPAPPGEQDEPNPLQQVELLDPFVPVVNGQKQRGCGGAAFRSTDEALKAAFNRELSALQRQNKVLDLVTRYGFTKAEMPPPGVTTEQLCRTGGVGGIDVEPAPR